MQRFNQVAAARPDTARADRVSRGGFCAALRGPIMGGGEREVARINPRHDPAGKRDSNAARAIGKTRFSAIDEPVTLDAPFGAAPWTRVGRRATGEAAATAADGNAAPQARAHDRLLNAAGATAEPSSHWPPVLRPSQSRPMAELLPRQIDKLVTEREIGELSRKCVIDQRAPGHSPILSMIVPTGAASAGASASHRSMMLTAVVMRLALGLGRVAAALASQPPGDDQKAGEDVNDADQR
jgi:hypothetical protein